MLKYDESSNVIAWGYSALAEPEKSNKKKKKKNKKKQPTKTKLAERFKLHLCKMRDKKIYLSKGVKCKTAITDYLRKMGEVMKKTLQNSVPNLDFYKQVLIIMTVKFLNHFNLIAIYILFFFLFLLYVLLRYYAYYRFQPNLTIKV